MTKDRTGDEPGWLAVGHVTKPHGVKGEVLVKPLTDDPDGAFAEGVELRPGDAEAGVPDADLPALRVASARPVTRGLLVKFGGVDDRGAADVLRDRYLLRPFEDVAELQEGEVFYHQLPGMDVVTVDGRPVGRVQDVFELQPADLLAVRGEGGLRYIPFLASLVVEVDVEGRRLVIDPPEGLLDL